MVSHLHPTICHRASQHKLITFFYREFLITSRDPVRTCYNTPSLYPFCIPRFVLRIEAGLPTRMKVGHFRVESKCIRGRSISQWWTIAQLFQLLIQIVQPSGEIDCLLGVERSVELFEEGLFPFLELRFWWQMSLNLAQQLLARLQGKSGMFPRQLILFDSSLGLMPARHISVKVAAPAFSVALASIRHAPALPNKVCR